MIAGVTVEQVLASAGGGFKHKGNIQIGRTPPISSDKAKTHFPRIKKFTGIDYDGMLFYDDSNWEDNSTHVEENCPGVVAQRTPEGMTVAEFEAGLAKYANRYSGRS